MTNWKLIWPSSMAVAASLAFTIAPAHATAFIAGDQVKPMMTYTTVAEVTSSRTYGSYSGVGSLFVETASTASTGFGRLCTGSLIGNNVVVTAAHCLYDFDEGGTFDPVKSVTFLLPSIGEYTSAGLFDATGWSVNPGYNGDIVNGNDVALFTLSKYATGYDKYDIFAGDPIQEFTRVGTGTIGGPEGTDTGGVTQDYSQREGKNLYEYYGDEFFSDVGHGVLLSDFDNGEEAHDVFGQAGGNVQTGIPGESNSSPGDSGGPSFIDGKIVSVTSFGVTGAVVDGFCGLPTDIDPYAEGLSCTNSSIGELSGDTWLLPHSAYINEYLRIAATVPEAATWAQMLFGFGLLGAALRGRKAKVSARFA